MPLDTQQRCAGGSGSEGKLGGTGTRLDVKLGDETSPAKKWWGRAKSPDA